MAYVDLRERRGEEQRGGAGGFFGGPHLALFAGLLLAVPALSASYTALVQAPPDAWVAPLYWIPPVVLLS